MPKRGGYTIAEEVGELDDSARATESKRVSEEEDTLATRKLLMKNHLDFAQCLIYGSIMIIHSSGER